MLILKRIGIIHDRGSIIHHGHQDYINGTIREWYILHHVKYFPNIALLIAKRIPLTEKLGPIFSRFKKALEDMVLCCTATACNSLLPRFDNCVRDVMSLVGFQLPAWQGRPPKQGQNLNVKLSKNDGIIPKSCWPKDFEVWNSPCDNLPIYIPCGRTSTMVMSSIL